MNDEQMTRVSTHLADFFQYQTTGQMLGLTAAIFRRDR
jgi:hypothetical protein